MAEEDMEKKEETTSETPTTEPSSIPAEDPISEPSPVEPEPEPTPVESPEPTPSEPIPSQPIPETPSEPQQSPIQPATPTEEKIEDEDLSMSKSGIWKGIAAILAIALIAAIFTGGFGRGGSDPTGQAVGGDDDNEPPVVPPEGTPPEYPEEDDDAVKGDADAPVTIIEFSDFQCPFCSRFYTGVLPDLEKNYIDSGKVRLIYRDFPLSFHPDAQKASEAAECAKDQGKFWEMHDMLYENQDALDVVSLKGYAEELDLDQGKFDECLDSGEKEEEVMKDFQDGNKGGVSGTPTFFINGQRIVGAQPYEAFEQVIEAALAA